MGIYGATLTATSFLHRYTSSLPERSMFTPPAASHVEVPAALANTQFGL